jgi:hypothetical protein
LDFAVIAPFEASDLKIARAKKHLQELETEIAAFFRAKPYRLVIEPWELNNETGFVSHAWVVRISGSLTPTVATIIGDIFHNLRTSLDTLACDLVRIAGKSVQQVYFPFSATANELPEMIKRRNMNRAGTHVTKMIIDLAPYKGGNTMLRSIHDMNILDKHQTLVPVIAGGISPAMTIAFDPARPTDIPRIPTKIDRDGQSLVVMPPISNLPLGTELPADWAITFDANAGPLAGREVIETLNQLTGLTESIVQLFRARFPGPYPCLRPSVP